MEKAMAPHSSTLAWKIPWMEEPGRLQSMGSLRVRNDWVTSLSLSCIGEGNGNPLQCSCLENPRDGGAWWAAVYGVAQSHDWSDLAVLIYNANPIFCPFFHSQVDLFVSFNQVNLKNSSSPLSYRKKNSASSVLTQTWARDWWDVENLKDL